MLLILFDQRAARKEQLGYQPCPAGLVASPDTAAGVAVKVLVELQIIAKLRVTLHLGGVAVYRPLPLFVLEEERNQPFCQMFRYLENSAVLFRAGGEFDLEINAIEMMKFLQGLKD